MEPTLIQTESLALKAGKILRSKFGGDISVTRKGVIDLVTEVDRESEDFLVSEIRSQYPHHRIITEEQGELGGEESSVWYIDPLDGTVNYAHGVPIFSISIAYAKLGEVILGVIYDPIRNELFSAQSGVGAWLNGCPIRVSTTETIDQSLLATGFPYDIRSNPDNNLDHFEALTLSSRGVRRLGSAAIDLAYVAAGRLDGYWEISISTWDIAAGGIIVSEAGGKVTDVIGMDDYLSPKPSLLATNSHIHSQVLSVLDRNR